MVFRLDFKVELRDKLKKDFFTDCNVVDIKIEDKRLLDGGEQGLLKGYVKDISGSWLSCSSDDIYDDLKVGESYTVVELKGMIYSIHRHITWG